MELCTTLSTSSVRTHPFLVNPCGYRVNAKPSFNFKRQTHFSGLVSPTSTSVRATFDETSSKTNEFTGERRDSVATLADIPSVDNDVALDKVPPVSQSFYDENRQLEPSKDETSSEDPMQSVSEFLANLNIKLDSEDSYTIFLYGGGALVTVYLLSAIIGAIDSIPVFPKVMEVVGLGYSLWFTTRYLLFKRNREELVSKIEELKKEILGSGDN